MTNLSGSLIDGQETGGDPRETGQAQMYEIYEK